MGPTQRVLPGPIKLDRLRDLTHLNGDLIGGLSHSGGLAISV